MSLRNLNSKDRARHDRINLGLAIAHATTMPNQRRSLQEIADYCDCSKEHIRKIEEGALKKCRVRLMPYLE